MASVYRGGEGESFVEPGSRCRRRRRWRVPEFYRDFFGENFLKQAIDSSYFLGESLEWSLLGIN